MTQEVVIAGRAIGPAHPPYVIAEMSGNHNGVLERALEIVDAAALAGVPALKLQTYTADTITLDAPGSEFTVDDPSSLWAGRSLHALYDEAHTPWEWHAAIFARCRERGIACFSSPFDETAVDFLEDLDAPAYKIASFENTHLPLIRKAASTGKPLIISTGMAYLAELEEAVQAARDAGCRDLILLKCTSTYPSDPGDSNLLTIPDMRIRFDSQIGLSDHTIGTGVSIAAVALGATVIERHFTLSRADGGVDSAFSMEPDEMRALLTGTENAWRAMGAITYGPTSHEEASIQFRRSLYVAQDMRSGDVFTSENLRVVRPGLGLPPKYYDELLGKRITRDAPMGTPLSWDMVE